MRNGRWPSRLNVPDAGFCVEMSDQVGDWERERRNAERPAAELTDCSAFRIPSSALR